MTTYQDALPKFIGTHVKRREDPNLTTGAGKYVGDIQLDNMAYMAPVVSSTSCPLMKHIVPKPPPHSTPWA